MSGSGRPVAESIVFGDFRLDLGSQRLWRGAQPIPLRPKTWQVLVYLVQRPGDLVTIDELLDTAWADTAVTTAVLTNVISELRQVFDDRTQPPRIIETVRRRGYRFIATTDAPSATEAAAIVADQGQSIFVGREPELQQMRSCWQRALAGERQLVLVSGEPGIGKSTLLDQFTNRLTGASEPVLAARAQCREQLSGREALSPFLDIVEQLVVRAGVEEILNRLRRYAPSWLAQIHWLLPADEMQALRHSLVGSGADRMVREGRALLEALAHSTPLVLLIEDLHWADPATVDLIAAFAQQAGPARILLVGTYRPVDAVVHQHPISGVARGLRQHRRATEIVLAPFAVTEVEQYLTRRLGGPALGSEFVTAVAHQCGGNPLFLEALATYVAAHGWVDRTRDTAAQPHGRSNLMALELPQDVRAAVESQLAQLPGTAVAVLEAASVMGEVFSPLPVAEGLGVPLEEVEAHCRDLALLGHIVRSAVDAPRRPGPAESRYRFVHILYWRALYERVLPSRRRGLHQRIGESLERAYGEHVSEHAGELVGHFEQADDIVRRIRYRELAAINAGARFSHAEVVEHVGQAIAQLRRLPETPDRGRHEANLQLALGNANGFSRGYYDSATAAAFGRAEELARQTGAHHERFRSLLGLGGVHYSSGEVNRLAEIVEQQLTMAGSVTPEFTGQAYWRSGELHLGRGEFGTARTHFERALEAEGLAGIPVVMDFRSCAQAELASVLAALGFPDQARQAAQCALHRSEEIGLPFGRCNAMWLATVAAVLQHDYARTSSLVARLHSISEEFGYATFSSVPALLGTSAAVYQGLGPLAGREEIQHAMNENRRNAGRWFESFDLLELGRAYLVSGDAASALECIDQALAAAEELGGHWLDAELYRVRAECLLAQDGSAGRKRGRRGAGSPSAAEEHLRRAIEIAQRQEAKLFELRAATTLARLLGQRGDRQEASGLLSGIVGWFTEGFDTADLIDAQTLLRDLAS